MLEEGDVCRAAESFVDRENAHPVEVNLYMVCVGGRGVGGAERGGGEERGGEGRW